ncbi:ATP-dependent RNA helicase [Pseudoalteromonas sp. McH1-7]|uniref:DEAD/DEAH box helicase n=1 Tax=Pseudoalteromonas sp. McH1-7 TaxID=2745574 RepID=UPI0015905CB9|nr:DEAD/DEAH box helicase [Pseudoalteromonas sp. McH1-7]NUZ11320.1 ATP-dependent RNA helicase [Pseudoalteromonas sp. McH1-7]
MSLPIESVQPQFTKTLREQNTVVVCATTGSGKSTQLPLWATEHGKVLVIEPRRIACTSLAEYVSTQSESKLGEKVGFAIRFEGKFSEDSQVIYATPGVALRWFFDNKLADFTVVMLDEFHERRWDMDLLLALLKQAQSHKLIVTSATLNSQKLATYLDAQVIESGGVLYPVAEYFHAPEPRAMPHKEQLEQRVFSACQEALINCDGDILVFLPGKAEIQACLSKVKSLPAIAIGLYSGCSPKAQQLALAAHKERRIILATNVAETSLTIPNVTCVIDSGLERRTHLRLGKTVLGLDAIGKDSAKQRLGRAGRTQAGMCIRLYGQHAPLIDATPPEIQRGSLTELVLASGCATEGVSSLHFIDPLPERSVEVATQQLRKLEAIDARGIATELGKQLYPLPIDFEFGYVISKLNSNALRQAAIDLFSVLSVPARVYQLPNDAERQTRLNTLFPYGSDIEVAISVVRGGAEDLVDITPDALQEAQQFSAHLRDHFSLPSLDKAASFNHDNLLLELASLMPNWVYINKNNRRHGFNNGQSEVVLSNHTRICENAEAVLVLDTFSLAGKGTKQAKTLAMHNAALTKKQLLKIGIGNEVLHAAYVDDNVLWGEFITFYGEEALGQTTKPLNTPQDTISALVMLILNNTLFIGLANQIELKISYTQLFYQYHSRDISLPTVEGFLHQKLNILGIESYEDIALIDEQDLQFDEVESWELDPFIDRFPLFWSIPELSMSVNYNFKGKRIELTYIRGARKDAPKKWELPAWSGFKIRYRRASKVVDVI